MKKNLYLIDYENTSIHALYGISKLEDTSTIAIFYSSESIIKTLKDIFEVYSKNITFEYYHLSNKKKNALDFMIATYLGTAITKKDISDIYILSNDRGYDSAINFATEINPKINISFSDCIMNTMKKPKKEKITIHINKNLETTQKNKELKDVIVNEYGIPEKYLTILYSKIISIKNYDIFVENVERIFGKKEQNSMHKENAIIIYKQYYCLPAEDLVYEESVPF
jgi:hypothetical protein